MDGSWYRLDINFSTQLICCFFVVELFSSNNTSLEGKRMLPCDIWSLGITIVELSVGNVPHKKLVNKAKVGSAICQKEVPKLPRDLFSDDMNDFLSCCLQKSVESRLKVDQLLRHKWVKQCVAELKRHEHSDVLLNIYNSLSEFQKKKQAQLDEFTSRQKYENFLREECDREENERDEMEATEHETREFLALELAVAKEAEQTRMRLEREARDAREEMQRAAVEEQRLREKEEMRMMRGEERFSRLVNDEYSAMVTYRYTGEVLKQSDYIGDWRGRHFFVTRSLITYYINPDDETARNRYLITPQTKVNVTLNKTSVITVSNDIPAWELRLNCGDDLDAWTKIFEKCIHYTNNVQPNHVRYRIKCLENHIRHCGWIEKQSEYLRTMNRRFLMIEKGYLKYFDREERYGCSTCRRQYTISAATTVMFLPPEEQSRVVVEDKTIPWQLVFACDSDIELINWKNYIQCHISLVS